MVNTLRRNNFLGAFAELRRVNISFVMSVCLSVRPSAWKNSAPAGWIIIKFRIGYFRNCVEKIQVSINSDKNNGHFMLRRTYIYNGISLNSS